MRNERGMSLVEILIVLTLMAVAGGFLIGQLFDRQQEGYASAAKTQMNQFRSFLEEYRRYCNQYPTNAQGIEALLAKPTAAPECPNYPANGFFQGGKLPKDPWGNDYLYESAEDGKTYIISSLGQGGKPGGEGFEKDIKSNEL
jgi:general secretion pathway protein G